MLHHHEDRNNKQKSEGRFFETYQWENCIGNDKVANDHGIQKVYLDLLKLY